MRQPDKCDRDYLRLLARILLQPGLQRRLDPSDVVQRTVVIALQKGCQFKGNSKEEWRGWLRAILVNELNLAARNPVGEVSINESSSRLEGQIVADHTPPPERVLREEQLQQLGSALDILRDDERTAVELKYIHGCSVKFISDHIGRTEAAVGGLLKRGMRKLRERLPECGEEEKR
jgi:RNA polymerase sigma-70 factor, ECF subfamily